LGGTTFVLPAILIQELSTEPMNIIVLASKNPVKIKATLEGFGRILPHETFELVPVSVASGVSCQPMNNEETLRGAFNRAYGAADMVPTGDFWVGIEGGVEELQGEMAAFAWVVILTKDTVGKGRTGTFFLPNQVAQLIREGKELGDADDIVFGKINSKQKDGAIGILTGNVIDRAKLYEEAVVLALVPFKNPELYAREEG
jgi:inosine/xanthosine triphosphatase